MSRIKQAPQAGEEAGFSLVELLIVITLMTMLSALAYPSLSAVLLKNQRVAAQKSLYALQLQQEEWRISHALYASDLSDLDPNIADHTHYSFSITEASSSHYELTAIVKSGSAQAQDRQGNQPCQTLTLTRTHQKTPAECWE